MDYATAYNLAKSFLTTDFSLIEVGIAIAGLVTIWYSFKWVLGKVIWATWRGICTSVSCLRPSLAVGILSLAGVGFGIGEVETHVNFTKTVGLAETEILISLLRKPLTPWPVPLIIISAGIGSFIFSCMSYHHYLQGKNINFQEQLRAAHAEITSLKALKREVEMNSRGWTGEVDVITAKTPN